MCRRPLALLLLPSIVSPADVRQSRFASDVTPLVPTDPSNDVRPQYRSVLPRGPAPVGEALLEGATDNGPMCVAARNYMNTQYTVNMVVNGKSFWMVPDSGSFEVLVPSSACLQCDCQLPTGKNLFPESELAMTNDSRRVHVTFGQGKVVTRTVNATVSLGGLTTAGQSLLLLEEVHLSHYCDSSYDGVMGLGFRRHAREDGGELSLLASMGINNFSMCFGRHESPSAPSLPQLSRSPLHSLS